MLPFKFVDIPPSYDYSFRSALFSGYALDGRLLLSGPGIFLMPKCV